MGSGENSELKMLEVSSILRENLPSYRIRNHCGGGNFKKQFKKADKCGAKVAVIIGENEIANNTVTVKDMLNQDAPQVEYPVSEAAAAIKELLNK